MKLDPMKDKKLINLLQKNKEVESKGKSLVLNQLHLLAFDFLFTSDNNSQQSSSTNSGAEDRQRTIEDQQRTNQRVALVDVVQKKDKKGKNKADDEIGNDQGK